MKWLYGKHAQGFIDFVVKMRCFFLLVDVYNSTVYGIGMKFDGGSEIMVG